MSTVDDLVAQQAQIFAFVLIFVQLLLGLAMIIAVLGIINTLALSMTERTRELGLLRAVGMKRGQVMWMVTVESMVISVFGALLGVVVGAGLGRGRVPGAARPRASPSWRSRGRSWSVYLVASVFVGLVAGADPGDPRGPARRAQGHRVRVGACMHACKGTLLSPGAVQGHPTNSERSVPGRVRGNPEPASGATPSAKSAFGSALGPTLRGPSRPEDGATDNTRAREILW